MLENFALWHALEHLQSPERRKWLHCLFPEVDWKEFRQLVIAIVLATDMSQHFTLVQDIKTKVRTAAQLPTAASVVCSLGKMLASENYLKPVTGFLVLVSGHRG